MVVVVVVVVAVVVVAVVSVVACEIACATPKISMINKLNKMIDIFSYCTHSRF